MQRVRGKTRVFRGRKTKRRPWQTGVGLSARTGAGFELIRGTLGRRISGKVYLKVKLAVAVSPARTVIFCSCVPNVAVQACSVYSPGGSPLIENVPLSPLTAKNGLLVTPRNALIHG